MKCNFYHFSYFIIVVVIIIVIVGIIISIIIIIVIIIIIIIIIILSLFDKFYILTLTIILNIAEFFSFVIWNIFRETYSVSGGIVSSTS